MWRFSEGKHLLLWCLCGVILVYLNDWSLAKTLNVHPQRVETFSVYETYIKDYDRFEDTGKVIASKTADDSNENSVSKKTVIADMDGKEHLQKVVIAFGFAVATVLGYSGNPAVAIAAEAVPYFTDILVQLVKGEDESNVWAQIEERLEERISSMVTNYHFGSLVYHINQMQILMKRKNLTEDELNMFVLARKEQFLPQTFMRVSFNTKWTTALPAYVTYMAAFYLDLIKDGAIDKCSLGKQLKVIRADAIEAAKALFRARYRGLIGVKHFKGWPKRRHCQGLHCFAASWLTFKDEATGIEYSELLSDVEFYIFHAIQEHTTKVVWENMIEKLNAYFNSSLCLCEDHCPQPILKSEIVFSYPKKCYGEKIDGDTPCALPCHSYDSGKDWCPTEIPPSHNNLLLNNYQSCKKDRYMTECFPVKGATVFADM